MNKFISVALVAGGLLLFDAPEASAHSEIRFSYQPTHYYYDHKRPKHMPYWLKKDRGFRRWYKQTRLRRHRHLSWYRLFDVYRWETYEQRAHRRHRHATHNRHRHHDRDGRRRHRH